MAVKSNIALSYLAMLSVAGFLLWVVCHLVQSLRRKDTPPTVLTAPGESVTDGRMPVDWPVHLFPKRSDDIPIPGRLVQVDRSGAFLECSVRLETGQEVSLYVDVPGSEQVRLSARVTWARSGRGGMSVAQVAFDQSGIDRYKELLSLAGRTSRAQTVGGG